ncbi:MAG: hypothetical protein EOO93_29100, partial [Pedobacter sp.]
DLDNTIYFTKTNEEQLMGGLYNVLENEDLGISDEKYQLAKAEMLRTPFQKVATKYGFKQSAIDSAIKYLVTGEVTAPLNPSEDYHYIKNLKGRKFIVTAGFLRKQTTKVKMLGISDDFEEVYVVDVTTSNQNKKDAFEALIKKHNFAVYSPDGKKIVFVSNLDNNIQKDYNNLYTLDLDTGKRTQLTHQVVSNQGMHNPSWSPDSTKIVYTRKYQKKKQLIFLRPCRHLKI